MGFKREISRCLNDLGVLSSYRVTLVGGVGAYLEGVLSLGQITKTEIKINLKKGSILLKGSELSVSKYCEGDLVILGDIFSAEVI